MSENETTSELRLALCAAICTTVMRHGDAIDKRQLHDDLAALPFERMGDLALIEVARRYVAPDQVDTILATRSSVRYVITHLVLCATCSDRRFVPDVEGRLERCGQCNVPEPVEPVVGGRRR